jgi:hypothetical protein
MPKNVGCFFKIFVTLSKVNNHPMSENYLNLVTLGKS